MKPNSLLVVFVLFVFCCVLAGFLASVRFSAIGSYARGRITLFADRTHTYGEYRFGSDHEFGHYLYDKFLGKNDILLWKGIVDKCGFEGTNAGKHRSRGLKYEEEFADSFGRWKSGLSLCRDKVVFLDRYG